MKATKGSIAKAVDQPASTVRLYLFHGPDESQSRALADRLLGALGASRHTLSAAGIKADPASLVDEAGALSLFGGKRVIWIEPANKDIEEGVTALLEGPPGESPVVAIAGALSKTSSLLKIAEASPLVVAYASYTPEGQDAQRMVIDLGRRVGLKVTPAVATTLATLVDNDAAVASRELEKLALYLDASPHAPKDLEYSAIEDLGADRAEGDFQRLADLALGGEANGLAEELARLPSLGNEAIPVVRSLLRRVLMLAPARARVERGESTDAVMASLGRTLFWKDKAVVQKMLARWSARDLAVIADRASKLERTLIFTAAPAREALGEELLAIARKARRAD